MIGGITVMKEYNKPTVSIVPVCSQDVVTLSFTQFTFKNDGVGNELIWGDIVS